MRGRSRVRQDSRQRRLFVAHEFSCRLRESGRGSGTAPPHTRGREGAGVGGGAHLGAPELPEAQVVEGAT